MARRKHHAAVDKANPKMLCQDWKRTVRTYDSPKTVFIFDPPWPRQCEPARRDVGWHCQRSQIDGMIDEVIQTAKTMKGKAIVALGVEDRKRLCKELKCRTITHKHGDGGTFRYLIGVKK